MENKDIIEGNKIIAEFMGAKWSMEYSCHWFENPPTQHASNGWTELLYHSSWDWLMPVVEKIEKCANYDKNSPFFSVEGFRIGYTKSYPHYLTSVRINICTKLNGIGSEFHYINTESKDKIEAVWLAVIEFIKFYNNDKN